MGDAKKFRRQWEEMKREQPEEYRLRIDVLERTYGKYKEVVSLATGTSYRVPTETIITEGIKEEEPGINRNENLGLCTAGATLVNIEIEPIDGPR